LEQRLGFGVPTEHHKFSCMTKIRVPGIDTSERSLRAELARFVSGYEGALLYGVPGFGVIGIKTDRLIELSVTLLVASRSAQAQTQFKARARRLWEGSG